jgi:hypothetical protein
MSAEGRLGSALFDSQLTRSFATWSRRRTSCSDLPKAVGTSHRCGPQFWSRPVPRQLMRRQMRHQFAKICTAVSSDAGTVDVVGQACHSNRSTKRWVSSAGKTIHILRYIDDPAFRRRILTQLNHTELRHGPGWRVIMANAGKSSSLPQGQEEQLSWPRPQCRRPLERHLHAGKPFSRSGWTSLRSYLMPSQLPRVERGGKSRPRRRRATLILSVSASPLRTR